MHIALSNSVNGYRITVYVSHVFSLYFFDVLHSKPNHFTNITKHTLTVVVFLTNPNMLLFCQSDQMKKHQMLQTINVDYHCDIST